MIKLYSFSSFIIFGLWGLRALAGPGDTCTNPISINVCSAAATDSAPAYNGQVNNWVFNGYGFYEYAIPVYYTINLPANSFQPVNVAALLTGYYNNCIYSSCADEVYFLWFNNSPCSGNPVVVDSFTIEGTPTHPDSLFSTYTVTQAQQQYYLVVLFKYHPTSYTYNLQSAFNNTQPNPPPLCSRAPPPYKGSFTLDKSGCATPSNPYHLPLSDLYDNPADSNIIFPLTINQHLKYLPINDSLGNGFILSLMQTDISNNQVYTWFDAFPFTYGGYHYQVGLTVFFKNGSGVSGLKGFRIQCNSGYSPQAFPANNAPGFYDTTGTWSVNYDYNSSTYTWLFNGKNGRGDITDTTPYSCEVYTFTGFFEYFGGVINAWYLPDNYGNDSLQCVDTSSTPRTDCQLQVNSDITAWVPLTTGGNGSNGMITGSTCGTDSVCYGGIQLDFPPYTQCCGYNGAGLGGYCNGSSVSYDSSGCPLNIIAQYNQEGPLFGFSNSYSAFGYGGYNDTIYGGMCEGGTFYLQLSGGCYGQSTCLVYVSHGSMNIVDSLGNIGNDIPFINPPYTSLGFPAYPCNQNGFTIPLTTSGTYAIFYTYSYYDDYTNTNYIYPLGTSQTILVVAPDSNPTVTLTPVTDSTYCTGYQLTVNQQGAYNYTWVPPDITENGYYTVLYLTASATYTVIGADKYGCTDTVTYPVKVADCLPQADFDYWKDTCSSLCFNFFDQSTNNPRSWQWTFPGGSPSSYNGEFPSKVCFSKSGMVPVTLVASNNAGSDTITYYIETNSCNIPPYFTAEDSIICANNCVVFRNLSYPYTDYIWFFPGGTPSVIGFGIDYQSWLDTILVCYADSGVYAAYLVSNNYVNNDTTYFDTFAVNIHIINCPFTPGFTMQDKVCESQCITYTDTSSGNMQNWQWAFQGGVPSSWSGPNPPPVCYDNYGYFITSLTVGTGAFHSTASDSFYVYGTPKPNIIQQHDTLNSSLFYYDTIQWYFDGQPIIGATNTFYIASKYGEYTVVAAFSNGCPGSDSINYFPASVEVIKSENKLVIIPNPTGGEFQIINSGFQIEKVEVYNIVGQKIPGGQISYAGPNDSGLLPGEGRGWKVNLANQPSGMYFCRIYTANGNVTVLKAVKE